MNKTKNSTVKNGARLNLGCGKKIIPGWVNVDIQKGAGVDKSFDFNTFPYPFTDNTFSLVLLDNVLEHLDFPKKVLDEIHRISIPNGRVIIKVPYYHCKGAYNDITHKHFFNEATFDNLVNPEDHYTLDANSYNKKLRIEILKLIPTRLGILFPSFIRRQASYVLGEIFKEIEVHLNVIKS